MSRAAAPGAGAERRRLCLAFVELVAERGCADLSAAPVEARAGTPAGSFERHFANLEQCFAAAWDELEGVYLQRLEAAYGGEEEWRARLRAGALQTARLAEANPHWAQFLAVDTLAIGRLGRERQRVLGRRLTDLLDTARDELEDPDAVPAATAGWIASVFFDRIYRRFASPGGPDLISQVPELMFLAVSAYFGPEAGLMELRRAP